MFQLFRHKIVHLDLKGAPLKVPYLEKVLVVIKLWGATGVLLEWEETFPYSSNLVEIGSLSNSGGDNMYTLAEVQHIMKFATDHCLEPIQLIQTIGHMEFALKHPAFRSLREIDRSPAVLCPSKPESQVLVRSMIEQALDAQPNATYLHIGADEVWHTAVCPDCQTKAKNNTNKVPSLYLDHIRDLTLFIKGKRPDLTVLMWDDMLRTINPETLAEYDLGEILQPVLWNYNAIESFSIDDTLWNNYGDLFPNMWVASAYKGANGSCELLSPVLRYVSNHEAWVNLVKSERGNRVNVAGIILTGWSRYDHYATLCELLPVSLPSLANCLRVLTKAEGLPRETVLNEILPSPEWPGEKFARSVHTLVIIKERCLSLLNSDLVKTWLNPWQIERKYTVPGHIDGIVVAGQHMLSEMTALQAKLSTHLQEITGERSVDEWLKTYVEPILKKLTTLCEISQERSACDASVKPIV